MLVADGLLALLSHPTPQPISQVAILKLALVKMDGAIESGQMQLIAEAQISKNTQL